MVCYDNVIPAPWQGVRVEREGHVVTLTMPFPHPGKGRGVDRGPCGIY